MELEDYGVTRDGFSRPSYYDLLEFYKQGFKDSFGEDINLSSHSPLGILAEDRAWYDSIFYEHLEDVYYSSFYGYAEGFSLDNVGKYIGIGRHPALPSKGYITIEGKEGTKIPNGFRVSDKDIENVFEVIRHGVIGPEGIIKLPIISLEKGKDANVGENILTSIVNPIPGVDKVYNEEVTVDGKDIETDAEFNKRYARSTSYGGGSTRLAIRAGLLDMDEVIDAEVIENEEMEEVNGIPPKSVAPLVFGGEDEDIAKTILGSKAGGIRSFGSTVIEVKDNKGATQKIGFTRPNAIEIYTKVYVKKEDGYPGDKAVKRAIINYIGGTDKEGIKYSGLGLNNDVVLAKIMASVMCLKGTKDIEVEIGTDSDELAKSNISIGTLEIAITDEDKVVIEHV